MKIIAKTTQEERLNSPSVVRTRLGGISRAKLFELLRAGKLQRIKIGYRTLRIPESSLQAYIDSLTRAPEGAE